jgi:hypothetical protein
MNRRAFITVVLLIPGCHGLQPSGSTSVSEFPQHPVMRRLAEGRARFLERGEPADVFSVFYYHVTELVLVQIREGTVPERELLLDLLDDVFSVWDASRSGKCRPAHWQPYFHRAEQLRGRGLRWRDAAHPLDRLHAFSLSALGLAAHIDGDLPDCIARVLRRHRDVRGGRLAALEASFTKLDPVFERATRRGFEDLARRIPGAPGPAGLVLQSKLAARLIVARRYRAWERAMRQLNRE